MLAVPVDSKSDLPLLQLLHPPVPTATSLVNIHTCCPLSCDSGWKSGTDLLSSIPALGPPSSRRLAHYSPGQSPLAFPSTSGTSQRPHFYSSSLEGSGLRLGRAGLCSWPWLVGGLWASHQSSQGPLGPLLPVRDGLWVFPELRDSSVSPLHHLAAANSSQPPAQQTLCAPRCCAGHMSLVDCGTVKGNLGSA